MLFLAYYFKFHCFKMGCCCSNAANEQYSTVGVPAASRERFPILRKTKKAMMLEVFQELQDPDTRSDLSMPPASFMAELDFQQLVSRIEVHFHEYGDDVQAIPECLTIKAGDYSEKTTASVHYYTFEAKERQILLEARAYHEFTHALRSEIQLAYGKHLCIPPDQLTLATPEKKPSDRRRFGDASLYKMESSSFHSGYYMEHKLLSGIWVTLQGSLFDPNTSTVTDIPKPRGTLFRIRRTTGRHHYAFDEIEGSFDGVTTVHVYHRGQRITRSDGEGHCSR